MTTVFHTFFTFWKNLSHSKGAGSEPDDGGLVQLTGDGGRKRKQFSELEKFQILFLPAISSGIFALVLLRHCIR